MGLWLIFSYQYQLSFVVIVSFRLLQTLQLSNLQHWFSTFRNPKLHCSGIVHHKFSNSLVVHLDVVF